MPETDAPVVAVEQVDEQAARQFASLHPADHAKLSILFARHRHTAEQALRARAETAERERDGWQMLALAREAQVARLREALEWYGEQTRLCRLIHSEGDAGRAALDADGGKRARASLATAEPAQDQGHE